MLISVQKSEGFAWRGEVARAHAPTVALRRRASVRRQGGEGTKVPRRFQPRLAAGFDETAGDGLEPFDRGLTRNPLALLIGWLAGL